jgi:hypothetical protein
LACNCTCDRVSCHASCRRFGHHTASSSQATINASYGLLKAEVETPLRSSKALFGFVSDMVVSDCCGQFNLDTHPAEAVVVAARLMRPTDTTDIAVGRQLRASRLSRPLIDAHMTVASEHVVGNVLGLGRGGAARAHALACHVRVARPDSDARSFCYGPPVTLQPPHHHSRLNSNFDFSNRLPP